MKFILALLFVQLTAAFTGEIINAEDDASFADFPFIDEREVPEGAILDVEPDVVDIPLEDGNPEQIHPVIILRRPFSLFDFFRPPRIFADPIYRPSPENETFFPPLFKSFFGDRNETEQHPLFNFPTFFDDGFKDLPANYSNSTHKVELQNGHEVDVNETIKKTSGDGYQVYYHVKVIQMKPDQEGAEADAENRGDTPVEDAKKPEVPPADAAENEIANPKRFVQPLSSYTLLDSSDAYSDDISYSDSQDYFPLKEDSEYLSDEGNDLYDFDEDLYEENSPDLSSDTRVNSILATSHGRQQGLSIVDPDAEVFDIGLVLKEQELHQ